MSAGQCLTALLAAPAVSRAKHLDDAFPNCFCEAWSLTATNGPGIADTELLARILTTPDDVEPTAEVILTAKLTQIYSMGMSLIREGASDDEILGTAQFLLDKNAESVKLYGAAVMTAGQFRDYASDPPESKQWFGVYATDDGGKTHHGDVLGTTTSAGQQSKRRRQLALDMAACIIKAKTPVELLRKLRAKGF